MAEKLKYESEFVRGLVKKNYRVFEYIELELYNDIRFCEKFLQDNIMVFNMFDDKMKNYLLEKVYQINLFFNNLAYIYKLN